MTAHMPDHEWAETTLHFEQVNPGEWETWAEWFDGTNNRRVLFRPMRESESRCDASDGAGGICCLAADHAGLHASLDSGQAAMPFIIAP